MYKVIKTILDSLFAFIGIMIMMPLLIITTIIVACDGYGSPFFIQERVGKNKKIFKIIKFRTMKSTKVPFDPDHPVISDDNKNLTKVGVILRKFKIDEIPQLFNILVGQMSFIGPRPLVPAYFDKYEDWEYYKFNVKPGLSGYAQVSGNGHLTEQGRSYYDSIYVDMISFTFDVKLFFRTLLIVVKGEDKFIKEPTEEEINKLKEKIAGTNG